MSAPDADAVLEAAPTRAHADEATLDQLFAEPIVRLLMCRDGVDEITVRHLLQQVAATRVASRRPRAEFGSKSIFRLLLQPSVGLALKEIRISSWSWLELITLLTGLKKNLSRHKAVKRRDPHRRPIG
jgi:hypothetical protein